MVSELKWVVGHPAGVEESLSVGEKTHTEELWCEESDSDFETWNIQHPWENTLFGHVFWVAVRCAEDLKCNNEQDTAPVLVMHSVGVADSWDEYNITRL